MRILTSIFNGVSVGILVSAAFYIYEEKMKIGAILCVLAVAVMELRNQFCPSERDS